MIRKTVRMLATTAVVVALSACSNLHITTFDNFGSYPKWLFAPKGQYYKSVGYRWDYERYALLYVYRPATEWSMDEVEAPSFNVNDERLFNFKGGGYTWYEMEPGTYDMVVRRGIFGFEGIGDMVIRKYSDFKLNVEAGNVYYLRYSEIDPKNMGMNDDGTVAGDGPLQLVGHDLAVKEMMNTKLIHHGRELLHARKQKDTKSEETVVAAKKVDAVSPQKAEQEEPQIFYVPDNGNEMLDAPEEAKDKPKAREEEWWPF